MCGIFCYRGKKASKVVLEGLKRLEYRGYDSAGIGTLDSDFHIVKRVGGVDWLKSELAPLTGEVAIGHTRWASHGAPTEDNAHPHTFGKFALVHNGIIENHLSLRGKEEYLSQTDSEVICHLLHFAYHGNVLEAISSVCRRLIGSYALGILCLDTPNTIYAVKRGSPLILGRGEGNFAVSDIPALVGFASEYTVLEDGEIGVLGEKIEVYAEDLSPVSKEWKRVEGEVSSFEDDCMRREIGEIPLAVQRTRSAFSLDLQLIPKKVHIVGCGTAYHAGLVGKLAIEQIAGIPTEVTTAGEFRYGFPLVGKDTLVVFVSQSGETADTLASVEVAKKKGATLLGITNVESSSLARACEKIVLTRAGVERSVAATKSYHAQLIVFYLLAYRLANREEEGRELLSSIPMNGEYELSSIVKEVLRSPFVPFLGRGVDFFSAKEGSLKLKEITYIPSEGMPMGEIKHGPIALIDRDTVCILISTDERTHTKTLVTISEIKSRGGKVVLLSPFSADVDFLISIPKVPPLFSPLVSLVPLFLLAYETARAKGLNPDRPRNLAKSVTVE